MGSIMSLIGPNKANQIFFFLKSIEEYLKVNKKNYIFKHTSSLVAHIVRSQQSLLTYILSPNPPNNERKNYRNDIHNESHWPKQDKLNPFLFLQSIEEYLQVIKKYYIFKQTTSLVAHIGRKSTKPTNPDTKVQFVRWVGLLAKLATKK